MITWTIGAGGLLGSAINRQALNSFEARPIPWSDRQASIDTLVNELARFTSETSGGQWAIVWAAGAATVSTSVEQTEIEIDVFQAFVTQLAETAPSGPGAFFLASSAGGVYAGSSNPPFSTDSAAASLSAYGDLKLRQEESAREALTRVCSVIIGRYSNIYGPGQNLGKLQGLISRLALSTATRQPANIFVSLDTMRDYIYVDDAARLTLEWIEYAIRDSRSCLIVIIATGEPVALGQLIRLMQDVSRSKVPVALGTHASSSAQVLDLRMSPSTIPGQQAPTLMSLPAGIKRVYLDILQRSQRESAI